MEEQPVDVIRECSRSALLVNRRAHRDEEADLRRNIVSQNVTHSLIADIANKLKTKSAVSAVELRTLKNGLLDSPGYTEVVLNTQGALRGLVRELTGQEAGRQCLAAECLCNLALGDARAGAALARAAGPYLVTSLDSLNAELAATCAWALGNAAGSGARAAALLTSQGAAAKLAALMTSPADDVSDAAATALAHFAHQMADDFRPEHVAQIFKSISQKKLTKSSLQLLFFISCHEDFNELITEDLLENVLATSTASMENIKDDYWEFVYAVRTLANIELNDIVYGVIISHFSLKVDVKEILAMNIDVVNQSLMWLLGNLFNYCSDHEFFHCLLNK